MGWWKYVGYNAPETYGFGSPNQECGGGAATAWDENSQACYAIYGVAITVGPKAASWQGLFEVCNFNWKMADSRPAVTTVAQLDGGIKAG